MDRLQNSKLWYQLILLNIVLIYEMYLEHHFSDPFQNNHIFFYFPSKIYNLLYSGVISKWVVG
jgi:hypothetical protein